jgi:ADP-ribosylglycohydrolase
MPAHLLEANVPTRSERLAGGLVGLLVGDALGVPYEFHLAEKIPPRDKIEFEPPPDFRAAHGVPPGTWSDDGSLALCLLASLLDCNNVDVDDIGRRFLNWYDDGYMAVDGHVFDIGVQTGTALRRLREGEPALTAGPAGEQNNGNGSLMRTLPLALWHRGNDAQLVWDACIQSRVTHGNERSQVCCALYSLWARRVLDEHRDPWADAVKVLRSLWPETSPMRAELEFQIRPDELVPGKGSGYVVDSLRSARWVVSQESTYEGVVKAAIALGDDTDTTACVAGGIAGVRDGIEGIPARWRSALRGRELYEPLLLRLAGSLPTAPSGH